MENEDRFFSESKEKLEAYLHNRVTLIKLQAVEKTTRLAGAFFTIIVLGLIATFILLFLSLTIATWLSTLFGNLYLGYGIVALLYIILAVVIVVLRKKVIEKKVTNFLVNVLLEKSKEDENKV
ncbi:MAG: phage holin family protein [Bacteroidetes bacterium]|nr:phage holin family protein [Bacteroidota bacterium]